MTDDLIKRLEQAQGPDRDLDCLIVKAIHGVNPYAVASELKIGDWKFYTDNLPVSDVPHYTASIDAALTLAPEGYEWMAMSVGHRSRRPFACIYARKSIAPDAPHLPEAIVNTVGHTPAIALCIAALRARAAIKPTP